MGTSSHGATRHLRLTNQHPTLDNIVGSDGFSNSSEMFLLWRNIQLSQFSQTKMLILTLHSAHLRSSLVTPRHNWYGSAFFLSCYLLCCCMVLYYKVSLLTPLTQLDHKLLHLPCVRTLRTGYHKISARKPLTIIPWPNMTKCSLSNTRVVLVY